MSYVKNNWLLPILSGHLSWRKMQLIDLILTWLWVKCENACHHQILPPKWLVKHVGTTRNPRYIFIRWLYLGWPWLWTVIGLSWVPYMSPWSMIILSEALQYTLDSQLTPVRYQPPRRRKGTAFFWPDLNPASDLSKRTLRLSHNLIYSPRVFSHRLARPAPSNRSNVRRRAPLSRPANGGRLKTPAPNGLGRLRMRSRVHL